MTHASRMHFTLTFMLSPFLLILSAGKTELRHACSCVCMCREVTWLEKRALRFHEIVCIREVKKPKCYFLKSCDPFLTMSLWGEQTASHRGVNHSLMLLAAADTSTLLFLVPRVFPSFLIFSERKDIYPHHNRACVQLDKKLAPLIKWRIYYFIEALCFLKYIKVQF